MIRNIIIILWISIPGLAYSQYCLPDSTVNKIADSLDMLPVLREQISVYDKLLDTCDYENKLLGDIISVKDSMATEAAKLIEAFRREMAAYGLESESMRTEITGLNQAITKQKTKKWIGIVLGFLSGSAATIIGYEIKN